MALLCRIKNWKTGCCAWDLNNTSVRLGPSGGEGGGDMQIMHAGCHVNNKQDYVLRGCFGSFLHNLTIPVNLTLEVDKF